MLSAIVSARQFAGTSVNLAALFMNLHNALGGRGRTIRSSPFCLSSMRARLIVTYISYTRLIFFFIFSPCDPHGWVRRIFINDKLENTQRNPNSITALERIIRCGTGGIMPEGCGPARGGKGETEKARRRN